jgi:autoinducer 2 (AI-2) kinase
MSAILERFCAAMAADEAVARFSEDKEVTLYFLSPDLGLDFHIAMNKGQVDAGMGPAEGGANVELRMRGEILDGMFAGTINTMECAMQGDISFTGDASKAMTIQHLQADMERLYASIREELGDPGDLAAIPQPD